MFSSFFLSKRARSSFRDAHAHYFIPVLLFRFENTWYLAFLFIARLKSETYKRARVSYVYTRTNVM